MSNSALRLHRSTQILRHAVLLLQLFFVSVFQCCTFGHELPDGDIERRVQVSIKPDRVLVEYTLEMNRVTLTDVLRSFDISPSRTFDDRWEQLEEATLRFLPKSIVVKIDDKQVELEPIRASYSGWSHRHLTCLFAADVQFESERTEVKITDSCFDEFPGNYRIAIKARSGVGIENGSAPFLVSKAKRVVLAKLSEAEKKLAMSATAEVVLD